MSNLQKFNQTLEDFNQEVEQLKEVSGAYKKLQQLTETYKGIIKQFEENSEILEKLNEKVSNSLVGIENTIKQNRTKLTQIVEEKTDQIRKENKDFYREIESTIKIKLDENKSQIKHLIENERNQIKQIFEIEFAKNTKDLRQVIEAETNKQTQLLNTNQKTIKLLIWIIGGLTLILNALAVFKLYVV